MVNDWPIVRRSAAVRAAAAVVSAAVLASAIPGSAQAQPASAMIVLDGSNSMNARLPNDKSLKFITVRDALAGALAKSGTDFSVGLTTFGARRGGDCADIEVAAPLTRGTGGVTAALERFQPRGFSPVAGALRAAAAALPSRGKASIVLVLDDLASCRTEDPCKVASELKRQNPALTIHVVGLAMRPQDRPVLACVASETGGQLIAVADGPGVAPAIEQALRLAGLQEPPPPARQPAPAAAASPVAESSVLRGPTPAWIVDESRPGVHLSARLVGNGPALSAPIRWRVWPEAAAGADAGNAPPILEATAPALSRVLSQGRYVVEAQAGLVTVRRPFEAVAGATPVRITLDAALLSVSVPLARGAGQAPDAMVTVAAVRAGTPAAGAREPLWVGHTAQLQLVVPPGEYTIAAADGLARVEQKVGVAAGATSRTELVLGAGRLVLETSDKVPARMLIEVEEPDSASGRREVLRTAAARLETTLPAGSYLATVSRGSVEVRERLSVRPGDTLRRTVEVPLARARIVSRGTGRDAVRSTIYRIERLDEPGPAIQRWGGSELVLDLTPGRYRFEARVGTQNAIAFREAEIRAGFETRLELDPAAGQVGLKLASGSGSLGLGTVWWQVFDENGKAVWRTSQPDPQLTLAAGRYRVRLETRDKVIERIMEIRAGDAGIVEIGD
jgi:Ca-activated chloride channel family protein